MADIMFFAIGFGAGFIISRLLRGSKNNACVTRRFHNVNLRRGTHNVLTYED